MKHPMNHRKMPRTASRVLFIAALAIVTSPASGAIIKSSQSIGLPPKQPGTGLTAEWFFHRADDIDTARAIAEKYKPDFTFVPESFGSKSEEVRVLAKEFYGGALADRYQDAESSKILGTYLEEYAAKYSEKDSIPGALTTLPFTVTRFTGYIAISQEMDMDETTKAIELAFAFGRDDGGYLSIGSTLVLEQPKPGSSEFGLGKVEFEEAGLYPIELLHFKNTGSFDVDLFSTIPTEQYREDSPGKPFTGIVPTSAFHAAPTQFIPEPGALALALPALLLAGQRTRRGR
jgi:hypothetical protein